MPKPIELDTVIDLVREQFPDCEIDSLSPDLAYIVAGDFSRYLLRCWTEKNIEELSRGLTFIEDLHQNGTKETQELATIGFLESIRNFWSNSEVDPEIIFDPLGYESKKWWRQLNKFWAGKIKYVGETVDSE